MGINVSIDDTGGNQLIVVPLQGELLQWSSMFISVNAPEAFQLWGYVNVQGEPKLFCESLINYTSTSSLIYHVQQMLQEVQDDPIQVGDLTAAYYQALCKLKQCELLNANAKITCLTSTMSQDEDGDAIPMILQVVHNELISEDGHMFVSMVDSIY